MESFVLTNKQARQFILIKQGLIGDYKFKGKAGVLEYVRQSGCIQFDPIDVCGKNAELVLQSRVKGFSKQMLYELLYKERQLVDYFDKNLAIIDVHDWKCFERTREAYRRHGRGKNEVELVEDSVKKMIAANGPMCSKDIGLDQKVDWYWSSTKLSRAALETLYFRGELIVHHKKGTIKYYALAKDHIPIEILTAEDPNKTELEHMKWSVLRRISAVGLMWNKPSDAWLCIRGLKAAQRNEVFHELAAEDKIIEVMVEGIKEKLYCIKDDRWIVDEVIKASMNRTQSVPEKSSFSENPRLPIKTQEKLSLKGRTELIAPLDCMLWDRRIIKELFGFDYKWEIYTPVPQRKYGYYVLPILSGESFAGRAEVICDRKSGTLKVENIWYEDGTRKSKKLFLELRKCFLRFMKFHELKEVTYSENCRHITNESMEEL